MSIRTAFPGKLNLSSLVALLAQNNHPDSKDNQSAQTHVGAGNTVKHGGSAHFSEPVKQNFEQQRVDNPHPAGQAGFLLGNDESHGNDIDKIEQEENDETRNYVAALLLQDNGQDVVIGCRAGFQCFLHAGEQIAADNMDGAAESNESVKRCPV